MARNLFKRYLPHPEHIRGHPSVKVFGKLLHDPNLWHLNRRSVTIAFFIGLFVAFIPLPGQMLIAGLAAIVFRANLPLSVLLVWVSNPLTMPPMVYFAYQLGAILMDLKPQPMAFEMSWAWVQAELLHRWRPFLLGCFISGLFSGLLGAAVVNTLWRVHVIRRWRKRRQARLQR